jgi:phospholipase C
MVALGAALAVLPATASSAAAPPALAPGAAAASPPAAASLTTTPIKHVIVIIGENHTFDNVYGTYQPPPGQSVLNLRSEGIVNANGSPGPSAAKAQQSQATDTTTYQVTPSLTNPYPTLPQPNTTYVASACDGGQAGDTPDARFPSNLPNAPYQITKYVPYDDPHTGSTGCQFHGAYVGDPIHRFYQMYQQVDGGKSNLFTWVHGTSGDSNGGPPPSPFTDQSTNQGALDMGYYNMATGDAPVLDYLAQHYAMSDNYHQAVMGGTGANHIMLGTGDAAYYQNAQGKAVPPPAGEIENPNPQPGTNNFYSQDGYGQSGTTNGGSYSDCSDSSQPGVSGVDFYLSTLTHKTFRNGDCAPGHYYLLNNYNPGYNVDGSLNTSTFTVPPQQNMVTIGDALSAKGISWGYFGQGYINGHPTSAYCGICDPMQYSSSVMTDPAKRANIQHGLPDFLAEAKSGTLPAVSFLKPGDDDGHPGYSTLAAFEKFVADAVNSVQSNAALWKSTAIFVTFDEGGGYYDSGPVQPVSFFGDGTRVPMLVISPYTNPGSIDHMYSDHVSILKFIEANWNLHPLTGRSLDNLPNPVQSDGTYLPSNGPALGNLMGLFDFDHPQAAAGPIPTEPGATASSDTEGQPVNVPR